MADNGTAGMITTEVDSNRLTVVADTGGTAGMITTEVDSNRLTVLADNGTVIKS